MTLLINCLQRESMRPIIITLISCNNKLCKGLVKYMSYPLNVYGETTLSIVVYIIQYNRVLQYNISCSKAPMYKSTHVPGKTQRYPLLSRKFIDHLINLRMDGWGLRILKEKKHG